MRYFRITIVAISALVLSGCLRSQQPLNPPQLVTARDTDMAIQLFMQASILFGRYYGFDTLSYAELRDQSVRHGYSVLPFMPPISHRATPRFNPDTLKFNFAYNGKKLEELTGDEFRSWIRSILGKAAPNDSPTRMLGAYYVEAGWRAAQVICRNYLVGLDEQNQYLEFLQKEFNVGATLANASFIAAGANVTLKAIGVGVQWLGNQTIDNYQEYRYLPLVDRDAARSLVEAAQNAIAITYLTELNKSVGPAKLSKAATNTAGAANTTSAGEPKEPKSPDVKKTNSDTPPPSVDPPYLKGPSAFIEAVHIVNLIEYQCTRSGIRGLVNKASVAAAKPAKSKDGSSSGAPGMKFDLGSNMVTVGSGD